MVGDVLCFKSENVVHIEANEAYGFSLVARSPGNRVGINVGYCWAVRILTSSTSARSRAQLLAVLDQRNPQNQPEES